MGSSKYASDMARKKTAQTHYTATLKALGKTYKAEGTTIAEAISKLTPGTVRGAVILAVQGQDKPRERILTALQALRLFNTHGVTRDVALKNTSLLFDGV